LLGPENVLILKSFNGIMEIFADIIEYHDPGSGWKLASWRPVKEYIPITSIADIEKLKKECQDLAEISAKDGTFDDFYLKFYKKVKPYTYETSNENHTGIIRHTVNGEEISEQNVIRELSSRERKGESEA
jgi:hypothetical protein